MLRSLALPCSALLALPALAQVPDPFAPHVRWSAPASPSVAWLPSSLEFAAGGELLWATTQGSAPRALLFSTAPPLGQAALAPSNASSFAAALGSVAAGAGDGEEELFTLAQYATFDPLHRRTEIARFDPRAPSFAPLWQRNLGLVGNGAAKLAVARDGSRVLGVAHDLQFQVLALEWLDAADGSLVANQVATAQMLRQMAASAQLERAAVVVGNEVRVYADDGSLEHTELLTASTNALAMSGDGTKLAVGSGPKVRIVARNGATWQFAGELASAPGEIATRVALDDAGTTLAIGWWDSLSATSVRLQVIALPSQQIRYQHLLSTPGSSLQNYVEAVDLTPDGRRAAFGCWGTGDAQPEALWIDCESGAEVGSFDLPGSARSIALDESGTRLAVGFKHVHANQLGSTGEVRLFDSGERDLQLLSLTYAGSMMHLAAKESGATRFIFLIGQKVTPPIPFGSAGLLWIDRKSAKRFVRAADPNGRADLFFPLSPLAIGIDWSVQAAARLPGRLLLGRTVVTTVIL